ncbi:MAG: hypothetical protein UHS51_09170 [Atopobiaceae bacterium]|nr:hypothetical protein [Atopobiaceae bacterium]
MHQVVPVAAVSVVEISLAVKSEVMGQPMEQALAIAPAPSTTATGLFSLKPRTRFTA